MEKLNLSSLKEKDGRLVRSAAMLAVTISLTLILIKVFAWGATDSTSVLASLTDSSLDMFISLVNLFAIRFAFSPADEGHPFGHGKAESIAALMQSAFIAGSALVLSFHAIERFVHPVEIQQFETGVILMLVSTGLTFALVLYQKWVYRQTQSLALKADSAHYSADILANISVLAALILAYMKWQWVDPLIACLIIITLLKSAWDIAREAMDMLMDHSLTEDVQAFIGLCVGDDERILGFHDLKTRRSGNTDYIQIHIELYASLNLKEAHSIGDELVDRIQAKYKRAEIMIHHDPLER